MNFLPLQKLISSEDQPTALKSRDAAVLVDSQESDTRHLYATLLKIWGVPVKESTSVEESISAAAEKTPAAVLLDCVFPFEENLKRIRNLRQSGVFDKVPIILLSGFAQPQYRKQALAAGADDYLIKPIDFDVLEITLENNIEKYNHDHT
jgi:DNA-binding response OmpR family regulator